MIEGGYALIVSYRTLCILNITVLVLDVVYVLNPSDIAFRATTFTVISNT